MAVIGSRPGDDVSKTAERNLHGGTKVWSLDWLEDRHVEFVRERKIERRYLGHHRGLRLESLPQPDGLHSGPRVAAYKNCGGILLVSLPEIAE
jgi:hypothetical protein